MRTSDENLHFSSMATIPKAADPNMPTARKPRAAYGSLRNEDERLKRKKELDKVRNKSRINIGIEYDRWNLLKDDYWAQNNEEFARVVLDCFETLRVKRSVASTQTEDSGCISPHAATESLSVGNSLVPGTEAVISPLVPTEARDLEPGINVSYVSGFNPSKLVVLDPDQTYIPVPMQEEPSQPVSGEKPLDYSLQSTLTEQYSSTALVNESPVDTDTSAAPPCSITDDGENLITSVQTLNKLLFNIEDVKKCALERLVLAKSDKAHCRFKMMFLTMSLESYVNEMSLNLSQCVSSMIDAVQLQQTQYLKFTQGVKKLQQQQASLREEMDKIDSLKMENSQLCRRIKVMMKHRQIDQISGINQNSRKRPKWLDFYQQTLFKYCKRTERRDLMKFQKEIQKVKGKCLSLSLIKDSSSLCKKYTGIPNYSMLKSLLSELIANSDFSTPVQSDQSDRKRTLSLENEFLLTLIKIKLDLPVTHLSRQFKVRPGVVREILYKWTPVLIRTMEKLKPDPDFESVTQFWTLLKRFLERQRLKSKQFGHSICSFYIR